MQAIQMKLCNQSRSYDHDDVKYNSLITALQD